MLTSLFVLALFCARATTHVSPGDQADLPSRPNIVLVLADDLGWTGLSCSGSDLYRTPNIDRLAAEGTRFTNAYAACSVCSPTRVSLLTGQYPARTHVTNWIPGREPRYERLSAPDWRKGLLAEWVTLPELLRSVGYSTAWYGKWHAGGLPAEHGFDESDIQWPAGEADQDDPKRVFSLTREATDFISSQEHRPFFVVISHFAVHIPIAANREKVAEYEARVKSGMLHADPRYAAMTDALDASVGELMAFLERRELDESTLVVFYSDNGGVSRRGKGGPTSNLPLRGGKGTSFEGGLRVPLIVRWPGRVPAGVESAAVVTTPDLLPTFCGLAGVDSYPAGLAEVLDGRDLWPLWSRGESLEREAIYWHYPHYHQGMPASAVRSGQHKLIHFLQDDSIELYDLSNDPGETRDLSQEKPDEAAALYADLERWRQSVGAQMMSRNPAFDPDKAVKAR